MKSTAFYDDVYLEYTYSIATSPEGFKSVEIRRKSDELSLKFYKDLNTYTEAELAAKAFIDGLVYKQEIYRCPDCGYTASIDQISRDRKPCCNGGVVSGKGRVTC